MTQNEDDVTPELLQEMEKILTEALASEPDSDVRTIAFDWLAVNGSKIFGWAFHKRNDPSTSQTDKRLIEIFHEASQGFFVGPPPEFWDEFDEILEIEDEDERNRRLDEYLSSED